MKHDCIAFCMLLGIEMIPGFLTCQPVPWRNLDKGLMMAEVKPDVSSRVGDSKITILRIDPRYFSFQLMCASEIGTPRMTAKQWCRGKNLVAAVNAGMFQTDGYTNVGYMKNFGHINNSRMNNYNSILAFNPVDSTLPGIRMIDRQCNELAALKDKYNTLIQNERMIDCHRRNVWTQQKRKWSMVALGVDQ